MKIFLVNTQDIGGGAEKISSVLLRSLRQAGHQAWLAVGHKQGDDPAVIEIPNEALRPVATRIVKSGRTRLRSMNLPGQAALIELLGWLAEPRRRLANWRGHEDFDFPGSRRLLSLLPEKPQIIQLNNLHGGYFDLRVLPALSRQVPVVLRLSDMWLFTGHCAHSVDCQRWRSGCGNCPYLDLYPALLRDGTAYNWQRKRRLYQRSRFYVTAPSQWMVNQAQRSILAEGMVDARVIPNGVDLRVFAPADKQVIRQSLGLPVDVPILLFSANAGKQNPWKDAASLEQVVREVASKLVPRKVVFLTLGGELGQHQEGDLTFYSVPYQRDIHEVAKYYQAADVYLHAARADTFPNAILEALACGTPPVATAVGGIPEQVRDGYNGFLCALGDVAEMSQQVVELLRDQQLRARLAAQAVEDAHARFDENRMVQDYINWYREILSSSKHFNAKQRQNLLS